MTFLLSEIITEHPNIPTTKEATGSATDSTTGQGPSGTGEGRTHADAIAPHGVVIGDEKGFRFEVAALAYHGAHGVVADLAFAHEAAAAMGNRDDARLVAVERMRKQAKLPVALGHA